MKNVIAHKEGKKEMELNLQGSRVRDYRLTDSQLPH